MDAKEERAHSERLVRIETHMEHVLEELGKQEQLRIDVAAIRERMDNFPETVAAAVKSASQSGISAFEAVTALKAVVADQEERLRVVEKAKWAFPASMLSNIVAAGALIYGIVKN